MALKMLKYLKIINVAGIFTLKLMPGSDISSYFECFHANFFFTNKARPRNAKNSLSPDDGT